MFPWVVARERRWEWEAAEGVLEVLMMVVCGFGESPRLAEGVKLEAFFYDVGVDYVYDLEPVWTGDFETEELDEGIGY